VHVQRLYSQSFLVFEVVFGAVMWQQTLLLSAGLVGLAHSLCVHTACEVQQPSASHAPDQSSERLPLPQWH